ncbi:MAG: 3-dehydroquinate synthase [Bacteroidota bacterium]
MQEFPKCLITNDAPGELNRLIAHLAPGSVTILTDSNTRRLCYPLLGKLLPSHEVIEIPSGEEHKNLEGATRVWHELTRLQVTRKGLMIIIGGGVTGDLGGFCAATYKRGIPFILVPTTLLAQVDASVGGKLGIDFEHFKNHIGVFQEPICTVIDTRFLSTLPVAELRSGFAEVIKHCLISDRKMWDVIRTKTLEQQDWPTLVAHSVAFKQQVVTADPREAGMRKILNFGHTIGHGLESQSLETGNRLLHGEAIAIGMVTEARIATEKGLLTEEECGQIRDYVISIFGHRKPDVELEALIALIRQDKKNDQDRILTALPSGIGGHQWDVEVSPASIAAAMDWYMND